MDVSKKPQKTLRKNSLIHNLLQLTIKHDIYHVSKNKKPSIKVNFDRRFLYCCCIFYIWIPKPRLPPPLPASRIIPNLLLNLYSPPMCKFKERSLL